MKDIAYMIRAMRNVMHQRAKQAKAQAAKMEVNGFRGDRFVGQAQAYEECTKMLDELRKIPGLYVP